MKVRDCEVPERIGNGCNEIKGTSLILKAQTLSAVNCLDRASNCDIVDTLVSITTYEPDQKYREKLIGIQKHPKHLMLILFCLYTPEYDLYTQIYQTKSRTAI